MKITLYLGKYYGDYILYLPNLKQKIPWDSILNDFTVPNKRKMKAMTLHNADILSVGNNQS